MIRQIGQGDNHEVQLFYGVCLEDQQAAVLGRHCRLLKAKSTYGMSCLVLLHTGKGSSASQAGLDGRAKVVMAR